VAIGRTRIPQKQNRTDYVPVLDAPAREALDRLKKFFASNRLAAIRNNFAYHRPTNEQMEAGPRQRVAGRWSSL
jgi:hypothetical protein